MQIGLLAGWMRSIAVSLVIVAGLAGCGGGGQDGGSTPSPPPVAVPLSDAEAARFLTQATFGPTEADMNLLKPLGYSAWLDQQVVLYWYQSHGRVIANEYRSKIFMVYDAVRLNRTDAALVRVISPRIGADPGAEAAAGARAVAFVKAMFPLLDKYLPS